MQLSSKHCQSFFVLNDFGKFLSISNNTLSKFTFTLILITDGYTLIESKASIVRCLSDCEVVEHEESNIKRNIY